MTIYGYHTGMKEQTIIDLYTSQKKSLSYIAKSLGMSSKTVKKILLKNGHEIRSKNATREVGISRDVLVDLYTNRGMSCMEIARQLNVSNGSVHNYLKKYELNDRSASQAKKRDGYTLWDSARLEKCRKLLLEHRDYQVVADLLNCTSTAVENKNRENWQIPMSIWAGREDTIKSFLDRTKNYELTAETFDVSEEALRSKNNRDWKVDLSANSILFGIPTEHNGVTYRSIAESKVAKYLEKRDVVFEYEKRVSSDRLWTCDFYLPDYDLWVEYDGLSDWRDYIYDQVSYNNDNPKIRFYQENGYRHMILGKRTWREQLDKFFDH